VYLALIERFYRSGPDLDQVGAWHRRIIEAIAAGEADQAVNLMVALLGDGSRVLGA
jgi:DNA-binding GntR family transcriptional regulator